MPYRIFRMGTLSCSEGKGHTFESCRVRHGQRPVVWSRLCKMARDQLDCEVEEVALVEASGAFGNACQQGFA